MKRWGGCSFKTLPLKPGEEKSFILILGILSDGQRPEHLIQTYGTGQKFDSWLEKTWQHWDKTMRSLEIQTSEYRI